MAVAQVGRRFRRKRVRTRVKFARPSRKDPRSLPARSQGGEVPIPLNTTRGSLRVQSVIIFVGFRENVLRRAVTVRNLSDKQYRRTWYFSDNSSKYLILSITNNFWHFLFNVFYNIYMIIDGIMVAFFNDLYNIPSALTDSRWVIFFFFNFTRFNRVSDLLDPVGRRERS